MSQGSCQNCAKDKCLCPKKQNNFEEEANLAKKLIIKHNLPMKLLEVEKGSEENQLTFHFSAETRVDFRLLVRDLQSELKSKIILHQVGPRDEAKVLGGYGPCGYEVCCRAWLENFESITTDMAKAQQLSSNLAKYTGMCGKLMCCLAYEIEAKDKPKKPAKEPIAEKIVETDNAPPSNSPEEPGQTEKNTVEETKSVEKTPKKAEEKPTVPEKAHVKPARILRQLPKKKRR